MAMNSLETLIKMQKTKVEEQQQILAKLQSHLDRIDQAKAELERQKIRERAAANQNPESSIVYADYINRALMMGKELDKNKKVAIQAVDLARDQLAQLFEEQKRYEIALSNRQAAAALDEKKRETKELDEIGSIAFARKHK